MAKDDKYYLFFKTEGNSSGLKIAVSLTGGYVLRAPYVQQTTSPVEEADTFKLNNLPAYILMYDMHMSGKYQFTRTRDPEYFTVVDQYISMDSPAPRHSAAPHGHRGQPAGPALARPLPTCC